VRTLTFGALAQALQHQLVPLPTSQHPVPGTPTWAFRELSGRLVELSGGADAASLTAAFGLILEAQLAGDRAAWVSLPGSSFFPPDAADGGIDLSVLPVVRVPDARAAGRAADHLLRSGGFGLVVIDLIPSGAGARDGRAAAGSALIPVPLLTRLLGLARAHDAAVVVLTKKSHDAPSLHSLISLRAETARSASAPGRFEVRVRALKDKRGGPGWTHGETCRGPAGVR
jgi:recombination protein RecA